MGCDRHLQICDEDQLNKKTKFLTTELCFLYPSIMDVVERTSAQGRKMTQISPNSSIWGFSS